MIRPEGKPEPLPAAGVLDPALLARLGPLAIQAKHLVEGALSGAHRARHVGASVDFAEYQEYHPGDEIRRIDWKAYGRSDRYYVRTYEQESQLTAYVVVDSSASMAYAGRGPAKHLVAMQLAAALAYLVAAGSDRIGFVGFGPADAPFVPARAHRGHLREIFAAMEASLAAGAQGDGNAAQALRRIGRQAQRRALVIVLSDFFDPSGETVPALAALRAHHHHVVALHVLDRHEVEFPFEGLTEFVALESAARRLVNPAAIRAQYVARFAAFVRTLRADLTAQTIGYHRVLTDDDLAPVIAACARGTIAVQAADPVTDPATDLVADPVTL